MNTPQLFEEQKRRMMADGEPQVIYRPIHPVFAAQHALPMASEHPHFRLLTPFFGATAVALIEEYVLKQYAAGFGARIGVIIEGYPVLCEYVLQFYSEERKPDIRPTYPNEAARVVFDGTRVTIDGRKAADFVFVDSDGHRVWIVVHSLRPDKAPSVHHPSVRS